MLWEVTVGGPCAASCRRLVGFRNEESKWWCFSRLRCGRWLLAAHRAAPVDVVAGTEFSMTIDRRGELCAWGDSRHGQVCGCVTACEVVS